MAKKGKVEAPNPNNIANRDILQRLNFLYQASTYLESLSAPPAPVESSSVNTKDAAPKPNEPTPKVLPAKDVRKEYKERKSLERKARRAREICAADIGRSYVRAMKQIGQKTTAASRDPTVKRTLCKGCDSVLVPGFSSSVRLKSSKSLGHAVTTTCLRCQYSRNIPTVAAPTDDETSSMAVDPPNEVPNPETTSKRVHKRRRRGPRPRPPPLFEREGHILFRGTVQVESNS
ncbi:Rpr2-domain-containing protein [Artomyces pyxidatus]|uniref:Rpr2-domain-containing protein n=1 Tax=Artomyces pyxidatus TaxID=48021 RepID=A0ACB8T4T3_9AGAM|nr:Rpr2-domain-containing protein [Artomyces pyxidatus]